MQITRFIPTPITRFAGNQTLSLKKNSPHILFGAGIIGVIGSAVLACRATLKVSDYLDEMKHDINMVKDDHHIPEQKNKDMAYVYGMGTVRLAKLYGPAVLLGGISIAALTTSHVTMTKRNRSLTAAYATLSAAYEAYRVRVRKVVGEERELELYRGIETIEVEDENGLLAVKQVADPSKLSAYARIFDEYSPNWKKNPEYNRIFVQCQQNYANEILRARGHVFLNEVYDMLGIPRSSAGQVVGWRIGTEGDNFIDFGIFEVNNRNFINGDERSILLDFNVDGVIYNKI